MLQRRVKRGALGSAAIVLAVAALHGCTDHVQSSVPAPAATFTAELAPVISHGAANIVVQEGLATVQVHGVRLDTVLAELAVRSGWRVVAYEPLNEIVSLEFEQLAIHDALRRILHGRSFLLAPPALYVFSRGSAATDLPRQPDPEEERVARRLDELIEVDAASDAATAAAVAASATSDPDASVREEAVAALTAIEGGATLGALRQALADIDPAVRKAAVSSLAGIASDDAARTLGQVLAGGDTALRSAAVDALGAMGGPTALRLLKQAANDPEPRIREIVQEWLGELAGN